MSNPFLNKEPKKDMNTVADYNKKRQLEMFRFSCFNNASQIVSGWINKDTALSHKNISIIVFELAEALYNKAIEQDYLKLEGEQK